MEDSNLFCPKIYNMKCCTNVKLAQWRKLFISFKSTPLPSLEIFGVLEVML
jgi:hypothetical protein